MAKNDNTSTSAIADDKQLNMLDKAARKMLISANPNLELEDTISKRGERFQNIIQKEYDLAKGISGGSIIDFLATVRDQRAAETNRSLATLAGGQGVDLSSMLMSNAGDIFGYFNDLYKNKYIEMQDLEFISKFIPAMGEAVSTTIDHITGSDDTSKIINRILYFDENVSIDDKTEITNVIEKFEKDNKLLKKLKNSYTNTCVTGVNYAYSIGYSEMYSQYQEFVNKQSTEYQANHKLRGLTEGVSYTTEDGVAMETFTLDTGSIEKSLSTMGAKIKPSRGDVTLDSYLKESAPKISFVSSPVPFETLTEIPAMEAADSFNRAFYSATDTAKKNNFAEATYDEKTASSPKNNTKFSQTGTYIKFIESKYVVPVIIMEEKIGYYVIKVTKKKSEGTIVRSTPGFFNNINLNESKKEEAINNIATMITDQVMKKFSDKFITSNPQFKKLIGDCIMHNGFLDNDYKIQFIPAKYMVEFSVQANAEGIGTSILKGSLFPAKLLLSLIICMMLNYMNKSGNKTIAHVYKGPIGRGDSTDQVQRVIRNIQESNITFSDLLSNNMVFSKFTRDSNIALPQAPNGSKLVEFETMEGQSIDMNTEFINKLEDMAIMGSGVPISQLESKGNTDFSRSITSSSIKFARRISNLDGDLEDPTTELYKIIINNSELDDRLKNIAMQSFQFKIPRPRILNNTNANDYISNAQNLAEVVANVFYGDDGDDDTTKKKSLLKSRFIQSEASYIDWASINDMAKQIDIDIAKDKKFEAASATDDGSVGDAMDDSGEDY